MIDLNRLGAAEVLDTKGQPHPLRETWAHQVAVLIFLRHFG